MIRQSEASKLSGGDGAEKSDMRPILPHAVNTKSPPPVVFYQGRQRISAVGPGFALQSVKAAPERMAAISPHIGRIHDRAYLTALKRYAVSLSEGEILLCRKFDGGGYVPSRIGRAAWLQASASALCAAEAARAAVAGTGGSALTVALCPQPGRHAFPGRWAAGSLLSNPVLAASVMAQATEGRVHLFDAGVSRAEGLSACVARDERIVLSTLFSARGISSASPPAPAEAQDIRSLYVPAPCSLSALGRHLVNMEDEETPLLLSLSVRFIRMAAASDGGEEARLRNWSALGRILARRGSPVCLLIDGCGNMSPFSRRIRALLRGYARLSGRHVH